VKYALRDESDSSGYRQKFVPLIRHPVCAWAGLRPALGQHTSSEHAALKRWAAGRSTLVEIGVAEGVSARALREGMGSDARLHLIDPFHLSRVPKLNFMQRVARRAVRGCDRGKVIWIQKFSHEAVVGWNQLIDLLFIDGDHAEQAVERDWRDWSRFVGPGGVALFHDACLFGGGWTTPEYGPVKFANRLFRSGKTVGWRIAEELDSLLVLERTP
jgi:predicted O-methyltransferase YrrM